MVSPFKYTLWYYKYKNFYGIPYSEFEPKKHLPQSNSNKYNNVIIIALSYRLANQRRHSVVISASGVICKRDREREIVLKKEEILLARKSFGYTHLHHLPLRYAHYTPIFIFIRFMQRNVFNRNELFAMAQYLIGMDCHVIQFSSRSVVICNANRPLL